MFIAHCWHGHDSARGSCPALLIFYHWYMISIHAVMQYSGHECKKFAFSRVKDHRDFSVSISCSQCMSYSGARNIYPSWKSGHLIYQIRNYNIKMRVDYTQARYVSTQDYRLYIYSTDEQFVPKVRRYVRVTLCWQRSVSDG